MTSDAVEGSFTCAGITLEDAEAHAYIYASAVADLYGADSTSVVVTFAAGRRRLATVALSADHIGLFSILLLQTLYYVVITYSFATNVSQPHAEVIPTRMNRLEHSY